MIYVRNDDVLIESRAFSFEESFNRFKEIHAYICNNKKFIHIPAIIINGIKEEVLQFLKVETEAGRMVPEVHCFNHTDYGKLNYDQVVADLTLCVNWFKDNMPNKPTKFFVPWAGESALIEKAAKEVGLEMVGGKRNFIEPHKYLDGAYPLIDGCYISMHWWKAGDYNRMKRLTEGEVCISL